MTVIKSQNYDLPIPLGYFTSRKMAKPVPYLSQLELAWLRTLDFHPGVRGFWSRPHAFSSAANEVIYVPTLLAAVEWHAEPQYFDVRPASQCRSQVAGRALDHFKSMVEQTGGEWVVITEREALRQPYLNALAQMHNHASPPVPSDMAVLRRLVHLLTEGVPSELIAQEMNPSPQVLYAAQAEVNARIRDHVDHMVALRRYVRDASHPRMAELLVFASERGLSLADLYGAILDGFLWVDLTQPLWLNSRVHI